MFRYSIRQRTHLSTLASSIDISLPHMAFEFSHSGSFMISLGTPMSPRSSKQPKSFSSNGSLISSTPNFLLTSLLSWVTTQYVRRVREAHSLSSLMQFGQLDQTFPFRYSEATRTPEILLCMTPCPRLSSQVDTARLRDGSQ